MIILTWKNNWKKKRERKTIYNIFIYKLIEDIGNLIYKNKHKCYYIFIRKQIK